MSNKIAENVSLGIAIEKLKENWMSRFIYRASNPFRKIFYVASEKVDKNQEEDWSHLSLTHRLPRVLIDSIVDQNALSMSGYLLSSTPGYIDRRVIFSPEDTNAMDWIVEEEDE